MADEALARFFADLQLEHGTPPIDDAEAAALLDLAREVAHGHERRFAPVTAYVVGRLVAELPAPERIARLRQLGEALGGSV